MITVPFMFQIAAVICTAIAAFNIQFGNPPRSRPSWGWLGMTLWFLSFMIEAASLHPAGSVH